MTDIKATDPKTTDPKTTDKTNEQHTNDDRLDGDGPVPQKHLTGFAKFAVEFGPLLVFFASFKLGDIFLATATFMVAIVAAAVFSRLRTGHISTMLKFTFVIVMILGGLTLYLQDETFVKMKLTVVNSIFAIVLLVGLLRGQLYIKMLMETAFELADEGWRLFTRNYIIFFLAMAVVNEAIWRTQSTDFWVNFKTFGYMAINFVFLLAQMPFLAKYLPAED